MGVKILSFETLPEQAGTVALALGGITVGGRSAGLVATVATGVAGKPALLGLSKLQGEGEWVVDSLQVGGVPVFANGVGARFCGLKTVGDEAINAALAAAEAGEGAV